jgi:membrane-associated protease RseP (regulator of RpoE activity)
VDSLGAPVWNAEVTPGDPADWGRATRTDHAGQFQIAELLAGPVALSARKGGLRAAVEARVHEGVDTPGVVLRLPGVAPEEPEAEGPAAAAPATSPRLPSQAPPATASEPAAEAEPSAPLTLGRRGDLVIVERVAAGSQAAQVGLKSGDVVTAINGETVRSPAQARGMLSLLPGRGWVIDVRRGSERLRLKR